MLKLGKKNRRPKGHAAELQAVLGQAEVPTFPASVIRSLEALRSPDSAATDVAAILGMDPGLTVRLLKLVNSAGYSPARPVTSVDQAVAVAGFAAVESLVLSVGVTTILPNTRVEGYEPSQFWRAASRRATIARAFADELHPATSSLSFTAGLLQDMAIPLLAVARKDYRPLLIEWHNGGDELHRLEAETFSWAHGEVAEWLCLEWDLPADLSQAISGHHDVGSKLVPAGVQLAAPLREQERPEIVDLVVDRARDEFGLETDLVVALIERATNDAHDVARLFV